MLPLFAEALRIQFFWRMAGSSEPVVDNGARSPHRMRLLVHWIRDQRRYFGFKARQEKAKLDEATLVAEALLKTSVLLSISLAAACLVPVVPGTHISLPDNSSPLSGSTTRSCWGSPCWR